MAKLPGVTGAPSTLQLPVAKRPEDLDASSTQQGSVELGANPASAPQDSGWTGASRAATLMRPEAPKSPASLPLDVNEAALARIDPRFPQVIPGSAAEAAIRTKLERALVNTLGSWGEAPSPAIGAAVDRFVATLASTSAADARKLLTREIEQLAPDAAALSERLRSQGYTGLPGRSNGDPTAKGLAAKLTREVETTMFYAHQTAIPQVIGAAKLRELPNVSTELRPALNRALETSRRLQPSYTELRNNIRWEMHDYFKGPFGGPPSLSDGRIGQIDQVANRAASNLLDGHAQALVSQGFTAESVRAFILNPAFTKAAERVGDAIFKQYPDQFPYPKVGPSREWRQGHHLFVVAARHGFADIEADLTKHLVSIGQPPDKAKEIAEKASQLFETELANEGVPKALATAHANTYGKNPPTAVGTGAKAAGWGERLVAALPTGAVETAAKSAKVVQEFIQASPLLMKALPIVGRVIPYVNTPIAALTSKHAYDVDTDPKTGWLERRLAEGAAAMNVVAAGAAYFPVPVLDWAASFTGGMISLGLSGMEWGVRSLREASEPPALAPQS